uniref:Mobile element protein n=1 Tax=Klebsiella pneumoniae subsp. pneumoniae TaxID=72407 RepID=A0A7G3L421_KLEPN|nr:hypothetical protein ICEJAFMC_00444 [Klebsiella pneumoniae subsp. pneumoniae]
MNPFKGRHFQRDIILWAVRWYCKYGISYRELQEMLAERGVNVDHSTIYRWVQRYAPEMENGCAGTGVTLPIFARGTWMKPREGQWPLGVSVPGRRQPGPHCRFYLSSRRNSKAAYRFLGKILNNVKKWQIRDSSTRIKRPPMVARLLCSNAKAGARLTLNTDRLSTGTT